jgi:hypothetical protein
MQGPLPREQYPGHHVLFDQSLSGNAPDVCSTQTGMRGVWKATN